MTEKSCVKERNREAGNTGRARHTHLLCSAIIPEDFRKAKSSATTKVGWSSVLWTPLSVRYLLLRSNRECAAEGPRSFCV